MIRADYPLSDDAMRYDYESHMYVLTYEYVKKKTGVDLVLYINDTYIVDKNVAVNRILEKVSGQVYSMVYSHNFDNDYQEYLMAKSERAREYIKSALMSQLDYVIRNGKINEFVGVNVSFTQSNAMLPSEAFRGERAVHPEAIQVLERRLETGESLLQTTPFYVPYGTKYRENY